MKIWEEFCVKGYYRNYDGMSLLKHALHNTCPDMMKKVGEDENGNDIKARDSEGIQLANAKIDEIRNGFTEWLEEQSPQFKERLTTPCITGSSTASFDRNMTARTRHFPT